MGTNSFTQAICGTENLINGSKLLLLPFTVVWIMYLIAAIKQHKRWPLHRTFLFTCGALCVCLSVFGPLSDRSHVDFRAHMVSHLLLGMISPLLIVLAAPMTLFLRTLPVSWARRLSMFLKSFPSRFLTHPIVAAILNVGGLWLLYTSNLYDYMHELKWIHFLVHFHIFMAGYLFTLSLVAIDPMPHRFPFLYRAVVLVLALAGHGILAKYIYAHPPTGVSVTQAELGAKIMYYGGDVIDIGIIYLLCYKWFRIKSHYMGKKVLRMGD